MEALVAQELRGWGKQSEGTQIGEVVLVSEAKDSEEVARQKK